MKQIIFLFVASIGIWTAACASLPSNPEALYGWLRLGMTAEEVETLYPGAQWKLEYDWQSNKEDLKVMTIPGTFLGKEANIRVFPDATTGRVWNISAVFYRKNSQECLEIVRTVVVEMTKRYGEPTSNTREFYRPRWIVWSVKNGEELLITELCSIGENMVSVAYRKAQNER